MILVITQRSLWSSQFALCLTKWYLCIQDICKYKITCIYCTQIEAETAFSKIIELKLFDQFVLFDTYINNHSTHENKNFTA